MFGQDMTDDMQQDDQSMLPVGPLDDLGLGSSMDSGSTMPANPALNHTTGMPSAVPAMTGTLSPNLTGTPAQDASLVTIKQQVLQDLKPLVGHLQQTPEEKFRTTMMMIQAADDQSLIPEAYEAAKAIHDDKARAQALLDVVNEINYFTAQKNQS